MGGFCVRLINTHDAELIGSARAYFVIVGRIRAAIDLHMIPLLIRAGKSAASDGERTDRLAVVTLQHLSVM